MRQIKILRDTVADGRDVFARETHTVSDVTAATLIAMGKAEEVVAKKVKEAKKPAGKAEPDKNNGSGAAKPLQ